MKKEVFQKISFRRIMGLMLGVLGLVLVLWAFVTVRPTTSYHTLQYRTYGNTLYPAGLYRMESWYASSGTILVFEWCSNKSVDVYAVEQNIFDEGMPFSHYLAYTNAKEGSMTIYANQTGEYVFAVYSPEAFFLYHTKFEAIHPIAKVIQDYDLAYFGAFIGLIGILILLPKRWNKQLSLVSLCFVVLATASLLALSSIRGTSIPIALQIGVLIVWAVVNLAFLRLQERWEKVKLTEVKEKRGRKAVNSS